MLVQVSLAALGADHVPTTLLGSCGVNPGAACRLVWDLSHDGRAASLTNAFLAGPVHLLLRVLFTVVLAFIIRAFVHRVINRLTERAEQSLFPQLRGSAAASRLVSGRLAAGRLGARRRGGGSAAADIGGGRGSGGDTAGIAAPGPGMEPEAADACAPGIGMGPPAPAGAPPGCVPGPFAQGEISIAASQAERALVDERRKQRVRALGSILRSAASVTIFSIAGVGILGDLGINLAPLMASAGVVGIAVGFGAQNMVRDYLSGIFMLVEDQYGVGDVITVGEATGTVETVTLRITRLRDVNGIVWHIRNGTIEQVGNESQGWARAVIDFPVPYQADLVTIRSVLAQAAQALWDDPPWRAVMLDAPEVWGAQAVSSSEVTMRIVVKTAPLRQWEVEREMRARVKAALDIADLSSAPKAD